MMILEVLSKLVIVRYGMEIFLEQLKVERKDTD